MRTVRPVLLIALAVGLATARGSGRAEAAPQEAAPAEAVLRESASPEPGRAPSRDELRAAAQAFFEGAEALRAEGGADRALAALLGYEQAARAASEARAAELFARSRVGKALCLREAGRADEAPAALAEAIQTARSAAEREVLLEALDLLSEIQQDRNQPREALLALREAILVRQELGLFEAEGASSLRLAEMAARLGELEEAHRAVASALAVARHVGLPALAFEALRQRAELELLSGEPGRAAATSRELLAELVVAGDADREAEVLYLLARSLRVAGEQGAAEETAREALATCRDSEAACRAEVHELLAGLALDRDTPRRAVPEVLELLTLSRQLGDRPGELRAQLGLGLALRALGRLDPARSALAEALAIAEAIDSAPERALVLVEIARTESAARERLAAAAAWDRALDLVAGAPPARPFRPLAGGFAELPSEGELRREQLAFLVTEGLWARALESCASCAGGGESPGALDLDRLRGLAREHQAAVLTWRTLDDALLAFAVLPSGRLEGARLRGLGTGELRAIVATVAALAPDHVAPREPTEAGDSPEDELRRALRRAHDALIEPLAASLAELGEGGGSLLLLPGAELRELPFALLLDGEGHRLGELRGLAELSAAPSARPRGELFIVADLQDPHHASMTIRGLHAALRGTRSGRGEPAPSVSPGRSVSPERSVSLDRRRPGRPRVRQSPAPAERSDPFAEGVVELGEDLLFLAGTPRAGRELSARSPEAARVLLLGPCRARPELALAGALVIWAGCTGDEQEGLVRQLFEQGAGAVIVPRWQLPATALDPLLIDLARRPFEAPLTEWLREALAGHADEAAWGSLRLLLAGG